MLVSLSVRDFVLIDELVVELSDGLNVLTGETGAGKSILVDALGLVLGGRANPEVVRTGCEAAEVEALFDTSGMPELAAELAQHGLPVGDNELVVRRVVSAQGRSKAYVNGRLVTASQLLAMTRGLVDISSQHESQTLCDASTHLGLLDAFAGLSEERRLLAQEVTALLAIDQKAKQRRAQAAALREREDYLRFQLHELDELAVEEGEEQRLEEERNRLRHADQLARASRGAVEILDEGETAVLDVLRRIAANLAHGATLDSRLEPMQKTIAASVAELAEAARELGHYADEVEANPARLDAVEERLHKLQRLLRKHGPTTRDLLAFRDQIGRELESLERVDDDLEALDAQRKQGLQSAAELGKRLSLRRKAAAAELSSAIASELAALSMGRARIVIDVQPSDAPTSDEGLEVQLPSGPARLTKNGVDRVEILIAPNPGEEPRPLRRIASGGELSRALLAVKRVLAAAAPKGLYVFDEVDAGVGGAVADAIGRKIADVARHHQVLCITHLPQIAAFADTHFQVSKAVVEGRTVSLITRLDSKASVDELARMLGGAAVTATTRKAAAELRRTARATVAAKA